MVSTRRVDILVRQCGLGKSWDWMDGAGEMDAGRKIPKGEKRREDERQAPIYKFDLTCNYGSGEIIKDARPI